MHKAKILVVEDEKVVALDIQRQLQDLGYAVPATVSSGKEAIQKAEATRPDLVLMDIKLEGAMDGIEAAQEIHDRFDIPVVYLTAYADDATLQRAKITEPFGYILKPFGERELHVAIEIALYRHRTEQKMQRYVAQLEGRNRELDAFAHTVAHDLKNPLALIVGFAEVLQAQYETMSAGEIRRSARTISRKGHKMTNIVDELLLLAALRNQDVTLEPLDMAPIVEEAVERLSHLIERNEVAIILPDTWPMALGYGPWVEEVWVNYLSNAIQHGGSPPRVELDADVRQLGDSSHARVRFWVRDNGPGLTEEEQERLFRPFRQLKQVGTQGHGLGLSIVQRIVKKLNGDVGVESEVGRGSAFYFTLHLAE